MQKVIKEIIQDIQPSAKDVREVNALVKQFLTKLQKNLKDAKAILGGSGAKSTWLKGQHDADIFVQYPLSKYRDKSDQLSEFLEKSLKKSFPKYTRLYGSRDYFQIPLDGFIFEVIPILKITKPEQAMNITDVSPLHAQWVRKYKKYSQDIRLAKSFAKAQKVYGAESHIRGFSGYVLEILTIHYGGFVKLLQKAVNWKYGDVVDREKHHKNVWLEVNKSKLESALIVIDPVQPGRNAAAALGAEQFKIFQQAAKKFLKKPSVEYFKLKPFVAADIIKKAKGKTVIIIQAKPKKGKRDVAGSKLYKAYSIIETYLEDFGISSSGWDWNENSDATFWYILKMPELPKEFEWTGPPIVAKNHVQAFKKKYKKTHVRAGKLYAIVKRKKTKPEQLVDVAFQNVSVKDRVKKIWLMSS